MTEYRRPKILLFTATLGYGGAESAFLRLAHYLSRTMDVNIVLMARDYGSADYSSAQTKTDLPIIWLDNGQRNYSKNKLSKLVRWLRMFRRLRGLKKNHDVAISFLSGPNILNAIAGNSASTIVSERGSKLYHIGIRPRVKWIWLRIIDPITYRFAGWIVPASIGYAQEIAEIAGPRFRHKIVPIEGGINATTLVAEADGEIESDIMAFCIAPTIVFCGRLDCGKGIDLLIPIFAKIRQQFPDIKLLVIGDGPLRKELIDLCTLKELSITEDGSPDSSVYFAGYREKPVRIFRMCRVFVFPSLHEGLGNALIEGVASGIPVLAADCPWGPRSILRGKSDIEIPDITELPVKLEHGTLMPLPNTIGGANAWESMLISTLMKPYSRRTLGQRCAAIARFDIEETGLQWAALIRNASFDK